MPELEHLAFAAVAAVLGAIVGWFGTPLVWVPWQWLKYELALLIARLRAVSS